MMIISVATTMTEKHDPYHKINQTNVLNPITIFSDSYFNCKLFGGYKCNYFFFQVHSVINTSLGVRKRF